jgi:hypothetical protein
VLIEPDLGRDDVAVNPILYLLLFRSEDIKLVVESSPEALLGNERPVRRG